MIFSFDDYKDFVRAWIESLPNKGRGEIGKIGEFLNISPSLVSTILNTERHFSAEQACDLCEYFGLKKIDADYFVTLVSLEKAGSEKLRKFWQQQKKELLKKSSEVASRIRIDKALAGEELTQYYSHALYSQLRVLATLDGGISMQEMQTLIKVSESALREAIDFLLTTSLLKERGGRYLATDKVVHVSKESPHYLRHHMNWRLEQLRQVTSSSEENLTYTFPCTLNQADFKRIKTLLVEAIAQCHDIVRPSPAEQMACLTIDLISYRK